LAPAALGPLLEGVRGNLTTLADLPGELAPFLTDALAVEPAAEAALAAGRAAEVCAALAAALADLAPWSGEQVKSAVQSVGATLGVKGRDLFQPVRAALTGRTHGPELPLVAELLGRDRCLARLRAVAHRNGGAR
jgi:nondiscriminating glutamyl-tRNA synthetase